MKNLNKFILVQLAVVVFALLIPKNSLATIYTLDLALSGQNEVPANSSTATGVLVGTYDDVSNILSFTLMFNGLSAPASAGHFHGPSAAGSNAPVIIGFAGFPTGATSGTYSNSYTLTATQESQLLCGMWYVNIHNPVFPGGELRSQLKEGVTTGPISVIEVAMTGQKEVPSNTSTASGTCIGTYNSSTNILNFTMMFNGLAAPTTAGHFHGPAPAGTNASVVIGFAGFPTGVTSGMYSNSYILSPAQEIQFLSGLWYINVHNAVYPGGELRGQLTEGTLVGNCGASVPTMSQWSLIILCLLSLAIGMIFIYKKQHFFAFTGNNVN